MRASTIAIVAATIIVLIITLAAIVAAIGLARMRKYYVKFSNVWTKRAKISDLYEDLKTGDIILFASLVHNPTNSMVTGTFFSHSAIVVRREGRMYLSETGPGNYVDIPGTAAKEPGACLSPLLARLRYYTGKCYVMRLSRGLDGDREESVQRAVDSTLASEYPYPTPLQMLIGFFRRGSTTTRHCFQHVAHVLDKADLAPVGGKPLRDTGYLDICNRICELSGAQLPDGYRYSDPIEIVYDVCDSQEVAKEVESPMFCPIGGCVPVLEKEPEEEIAAT